MNEKAARFNSNVLRDILKVPQGPWIQQSLLHAPLLRLLLKRGDLAPKLPI